MDSTCKPNLPFSFNEPFDFILESLTLPEMGMSDRADLSGLSTFAAECFDFPPLGLSPSPFSSSSTSLSNQNSIQVSLEFENQNPVVSMSTAFYPGSMNEHGPPELIFFSCDSVLFYVHHHRLISASENGFHNLLPVRENQSEKQTPIHLPETSAVLNVILHAIYDVSCLSYAPSFETLSTAINALKFYGVCLHKVLSPPSRLFTLLLSHAPFSPLELYALAASNDLSDLAISTSPHLLSISLAEVTDEIALRIGAPYLRRLFFLHLGRVEAFKRILLPPPPSHTPNRTCGVTEQTDIGRAWALASAYLAWDAQPDISGCTVEMALTPLAKHLRCEICRMALNDRVKSLVVQWSKVKRTI